MQTPDIEHLLGELRRIEEFAKANSATHFVLAAHYGCWARWLGALPLLVGALVSGLVLKDPSIINDVTARWFALATAAAGTVSTFTMFLSPERSRSDHARAAVRYNTLENEARRAYSVFAREESRDQVFLRVRELSRRYDELAESSPLTQDWAYERAVTRVKAGTFDSDLPTSATGKHDA